MTREQLFQSRYVNGERPLDAEADAIESYRPIAYRSWGTTTTEKLRGPRFGSQHRSACALRPASWVLGAGGGRPFRRESPGVSPPENFWKLCNPAFWWLLYLLLWNFLLFENYGQKVGGPVLLGTILPRSLRLLRLCLPSRHTILHRLK